MTVAVALMAVAAAAAAAALAEAAVHAPALRLPGRGRRNPPAAASARWAARRGADERTERLLDAAGRGTVPDAHALGAQRRLGAVVGAAWGGAVGLLLLPAGPAIGVSLACASLGRGLPGVLLARAGAKRAAVLQRDVPEVLDLLGAALACGQPVQDALATLAEWGEGPLAAGAGRAASEVRHGAGLDQALARLVREHPVAELEAAVALLQRSRRHGSPAAGPMRALAAGAREARARRAMDHAAKAAPRVQLVAALLLVPAALCMLAAALLAGGIGA